MIRRFAATWSPATRLRACPQCARTQSTEKCSPAIFPRRQTTSTNFDAQCGLPWKMGTGGGDPVSHKHSKVSEHSS